MTPATTTRQRKHHITNVIFDLDDTLYDCYRQRVLHAHRYACQKMLAAGLRTATDKRPTLETLLRLRLRLSRAQPDPENLDHRLCLTLGLTGPRAKQIAQVGRRAYFGFPVDRLRLFADTLPLL